MIEANVIDPAVDWRQDPRHAQFDGKILGRLQATLSFWESKGYAVVPLPWMAPEKSMAHTRPQDALLPEPATHEGALVASAEQSFLWLDAQGQLPTTQSGFIGWTPCFRHEKHYDSQHHHYFMKAELFVPIYSDPRARLDELVSQVANAWRALAMSEGRRDVLPERLRTSKHSLDLMVEGVELGSFGIRDRLDGQGPYLYGTALAEPRWSNTWPR